MEFDEDDKLIVKSLKKTIKHEENAFDSDDFYNDDDLLVTTKKIK